MRPREDPITSTSGRPEPAYTRRSPMFRRAKSVNPGQWRYRKLRRKLCINLDLCTAFSCPNSQQIGPFCRVLKHGGGVFSAASSTYGHRKAVPTCGHRNGKKQEKRRPRGCLPISGIRPRDPRRSQCRDTLRTARPAMPMALRQRSLSSAIFAVLSSVVMVCLFRLSDPHGGGERGHVCRRN